MMEKAISSRLIAEMKRVRDDVMPRKILEEFRGSRAASASLEAIRELLDGGTAALADQDGERCLEIFGELKTVGA
jgi:hypothetical protein